MTSNSKILRFGLLVLVLLALFGLAVAKSQPAMADTATTAESAVYIIQLSDAPLASYRGGVEGLSATSPSALGQRKLDMNSAASRAYLDHLQSVQDAFVAGVASTLGRSVDVRYYYQVAFNGVAITMSPAEAAQVAALDGVQMIVRETFEMPLTDTGPTFIGAPGIWNGTATGGMGSTYGEGVIAGIIDSGINVIDDHPSFWEVGGDGYVHTNPLADYVGVCAGGNTNPDLTCNDKMIGYRGYNGETPGDSDGHGSHTASTVAGNFTQGSIAATIPVTLDISGVAPHANIISYDACVTSCPSAGLLAAVNDATADGVDVINYSISGGSNPYGDPVEQAFLSARDAGVFVSASAGNNGPGAGTVAHVSPWLTTVAASTHSRTWVNQLTNMSGGTNPPADMTGRSISAGYGPAPIVHAGDYGDPLCGTPFPAGTWTNGEIVVCDRGTFGRVEKGVNVLAGGAGGYVLANAAANGESINADAHALPAIHLGYADSQVLLAWLASGSGHTATITEGTYTLDPALGDIMAGFSSRGPVGSLPDLVKPDVTAPGVDIFAAYADPVDFEFLSGTSMSSPHNAGAGALLTALHPDWTPAEIQSALMTTALTDVVKEDGVTPADPFDIGAGRINLNQAGMAGLVMDETLANYVAANPSLGGDPRTLNTPSMGDNDCGGSCSWTRTFRNTMDFTVVYDVSLDLPAGVTGTVNPTQLAINAGGTGTVTVDLDVSGAPTGSWMFAQLNLEPAPVEGLTGGPVQVCSTTPLPIPDNLPAGATSTINPGVSATVLDANVIINATHSWVGDMIFTVEHNGTSVTVYDRPGVPASTFGCSGDNVAATLDDSAATPVENECGAGVPTINGSFIPNNPLSVFNGMDVNGDWTITASDLAAGDTGTLDQWCMEVTLDGGGGGGIPAQHLPIAFIPTSSVSNIIVTPSSLANTQPTNTTAVLPLNIANTGGATLDWNIFEDGGGTSPQGLWSDNFDSYANGTNLHGVNGWKGWGNDPNAAAVVTNAASFSAPNSVDINGPSDLVHEYSGATSGTWAYIAYQYVPGNMTGVSYFILLNQYDDAGTTNNWSTQVQFDGVNNIVLSDPDGATLPLIRDRWVEIRVEIDLNADSQTFFYDNTILYTKSWTEGNSGGGILNIGAVDLFANGATTVYYDDMSLSQIGGGTCSAPVDIPWASVNPTAGSISAGGNSDVDVTLDSTGLAAGTYSGNLCVESNDPDTPLVVVPVDLTVEAGGGDPDIEVAPSSLTATQAPDTTTMQTLTISNVGSADLDWMISEETAVAFNGPFVNNPLSASEEVGSAGAGSSNPAPLSDFEWPEAVLWDNGPLVTHPGGGAGGADESRLQNSSLLMTTLGFGHQVLNNNWVADDFVVSDAAGWTVDAATFFAYQTGSTTTSTMTNVNWILYDGDPSGGGMMLTSGSGLQTSVWSNIYRATETSIGATDRPIMATTVDMGGLFLPAGTYWLAWQTDGTLGSGPWAPPITITGQSTTGNGLQSLGGTASFAAANDGGTLTQQGFPFILEGSVGGGDFCDAADIPWASANPTMGTTAAGGSSDVDVTFDSTGLAIGVYTGTLCIESNDPVDPIVRVPLTLNVVEEPPMPAIVVTATVGLDPMTCATTSSLVVGQPTTDVYYCYTVENTGNITLSLHDITDDVGTNLTGVAYDLAPGATADTVALGLVISETVSTDTTNTVVWTGYAGSAIFATDSSTASVTEAPTDVSLTSFGSDAGLALQPVLLAAVLALFLGVAVLLRRRTN